MENLEKCIAEYAELVVRTGANVKKGQRLIVSCPVECAFFARAVAEAAYAAGCKEVVTDWRDDYLSRLKYLKADDSIFDEVPRWRVSFYNDYANEQAAVISVYSSDPENMKGVSPDRLQRAERAAGRELKEYQSLQMANHFQWCIASVPSGRWAKKVFPGVSGEEAIQRLWNAILKTVHVSGDGSAVETWRNKVKVMESRAGKLNDYRFAKLIYKNSLGTDLTIELPENHMWVACGESAKTGVSFVANMPTEEVFTLPKKDGVNGVVYASKPLVLSGNVIEGIRLTVKDGRIVEADAETGLENLIKSLDTDEGARYFGEIALVPFHSPISEMDILFYNTLFDENASCHLAYGKAYPTFTDADGKTEEELIRRGMNDSAVHEDFMVGTADLSITGLTADGKETEVFTSGDWAF